MWTAGAFAAVGAPPVRLAQRILHAALLGMEDSAATERALQLLTRYVPVDSALALFETRAVWSVSWTLGSWHAERGDTAIALRWLALVPQFPSGGSPVTWRESIATDVRARLQARRGKSDSSRALAEQALALWTIHTENISDADLEPALRFRYARALREGGMVDSAARILRSFLPPTSWIGSYVPHAHLALGSIAQAAGDKHTAASHYEQARQLLALGGAAVDSLRSRAEAALRDTGLDRVFRYGVSATR
jgi:hypothetical protein